MQATDRRKRIVGIVTLIAMAAAVMIAGVTTVLLTRSAEQPPVTLPEFASLADAPDSDLHGTVAYYSTESGCVRVVPVSGAPVADLVCLHEPEGRYGPALMFRPDGRLAITMMEGSPATGTVAWQKVVDPGTGIVEDTPAAGLPASVEEALATYPVPSTRGLRSTSQDDRIEITVYGLGAQRYVYAENGPPGYHLAYDPIWSPDGEWILIDDTRLLVVTVSHPPITRILAADPGWIGPASGTGFPVIAFTPDDLPIGG
ncbi:MAG: hypothetical protein KKE89_10540 [Actinobacteria bacterium]|nr:hypothetical protein [Actinomycetota bacterium]